MAGRALLNAFAFIGGNYLARFLSGDDPKASVEEKIRHDKALEAYQAAYAKYQKDRTKLLDWIESQHEIKEQAKQNFITRPTNRTNSRFLKSQRFLTFTSPASSKSKAPVLLLLDTLLFVSYNLKNKIISIYDGCKTCKGVLQPTRVLKRYSRYKKVRPGCKRF